MTTVNISALNLQKLQEYKTLLEKGEQTDETLGLTLQNINYEIEKRGVTNCSTIEGTKNSIQADMEVLKTYESAYQSIVESQEELEGKCAEFEYPNLEKIDSSSSALSALKKVESQIERLNSLVSLTKNAIEVLEKGKETAQKQLEKREKEYETTQQEIIILNEKIAKNEEKAQKLSDDFVANIESQAKKFAQQYAADNLEAQGITLEEFIQSKIASLSPPNTIDSLCASSQALSQQVKTKGEQLKLIGSAMDTLTEVIQNINGHLDIQNGKLASYNQELEIANQYKSGCIKIYNEFKKAESKKKKKRGLKGFLKRALNAAKSVAKSIARGIAKGIQAVSKGVVNTVKNVGKAIGTTAQTAFKTVGDLSKGTFFALGDTLDAIGFDDMGKGLKSVGKFCEGANDFVGAACNMDSNDIKNAYKEMKDNAAQSAIFAAVLAASVYTGGAASAAMSTATAGTNAVVSTIATEAANRTASAAASNVVNKFGQEILGKEEQ